MRVICVDDERVLLEEVTEMCMGLPEVETVTGFHRAGEALEWIETEGKADLALLDIDMPGMNGIELAMNIKAISPDTAIIFLTGYAQYAVDVISNHIDAAGYILKPVSAERLSREIAYVFSSRERAAEKRVEIRTFGEFDVFIDQELVSFPRSKAKELLAYLVDRRGSGVTRKRIFAELWEDGDYTRQKQKYLDVIIRSLKSTLAEHGADDILELKQGVLRVLPEKIDCDMYRFFEGGYRCRQRLQGRVYERIFLGEYG